MPGTGVDRKTGAVITGWAHVVQSVEVILTTPQLTRVMRRAFGSDVPKLIDAPMNNSTLLALYSAMAEALELWEPRFELKRIAYATASADGSVTIALAGVYYPRGHLGDRSPDNGQERTVSLVQINESLWRASP